MKEIIRQEEVALFEPHAVCMKCSKVEYYDPSPWPVQWGRWTSGIWALPQETDMLRTDNRVSQSCALNTVTEQNLE